MSGQVVFPLDSFREAATHLRRPFTPEAVKFKVQATWPKDNPTGGLVVAYIDARLAVERLNLIVPDRWSDHYEPAPWLGKDLLLCHLTVDGITRTDVGQGQGKGLMSDALKRAAVKFGVGVSLYAIPKMTISVESGQAKPRRTKDGLTLEMTPRGDGEMRRIYEMWLARHGSEAFGEPLSHGDVEGAAGDPEEVAPLVPEPASEPAAPPASNGGLTVEDARALASMIREAGWAGSKVRMRLVGIGLDDVPERVTPTVLRKLTAKQADELRHQLNADIDRGGNGN